MDLDTKARPSYSKWMETFTNLLSTLEKVYVLSAVKCCVVWALFLDFKACYLFLKKKTLKQYESSGRGDVTYISYTSGDRN